MFDRKKRSADDGSQVPVPNADAKVADLGSETLIYSTRLTTMIQLDACGALVWKLCDGQRSVAEIVSRLTEAYPDSSEHVEGDVWQTLHQLNHEGVLTLQSR